jgi:hypothetical protein
MRKLAVVLAGTAALVASLSSCGTSTDQPAAPVTSQSQQAQSPDQELDQIGSTLDAIDGELASDGSP